MEWANYTDAPDPTIDQVEFERDESHHHHRIMSFIHFFSPTVFYFSSTWELDYNNNNKRISLWNNIHVNVAVKYRWWVSQPLTLKRERPHDLSHSKWWGRQAEVYFCGWAGIYQVAVSVYKIFKKQNKQKQKKTKVLADSKRLVIHSRVMCDGGWWTTTVNTNIRKDSEMNFFFLPLFHIWKKKGQGPIRVRTNYPSVSLV